MVKRKEKNPQRRGTPPKNTVEVVVGGKGKETCSEKDEIHKSKRQYIPSITEGGGAGQAIYLKSR